MDMEGQPIIPADCHLVTTTQRGTTLELNGAKVHTTEHVLAALYGREVDNVLIQIDGPEMPIMDGSAYPFLQAIESVGFVDQNADRQYFELKRNLTFEDKDRGIEM
jgi:UDP-3-O-[3-hydroxymyristoyl] N-acetylglucosamine deacetylase/3-hydroxyacyl-[acyl-carrier-protein] dehydratase